MKKFTIFQLLAISMFFVCIFSFCIGYALCESKSGNIIWDKTFGGSENDVAFSIIQTKDGGYAISGYTIFKNIGEADLYIIKFDEQGNIKWDKRIGGSNGDDILSIIQAKDGDYIAVGETESKGAGDWDGWIIKLDEQGNTKWDKTIGGSYCDSILSIIQTKDGDYIAAGWTMSKGAGGADAWVIKLEEK